MPGLSSATPAGILSPCYHSLRNQRILEESPLKEMVTDFVYNLHIGLFIAIIELR